MEDIRTGLDLDVTNRTYIAYIGHRQPIHVFLVHYGCSELYRYPISLLKKNPTANFAPASLEELLQTLV